MSVSAIVAAVVVILDLICMVVIVFFERKNPTATLAWVLVLLFLPLVGFIAYLIFGSGLHVNSNRRYALKNTSDEIYKDLISGYLEEYGGIRCYAELSPTFRLIQFLENDGMCLKTDNNTVDVFTDGNTMFDSLCADVASAEKHIHILFYIFKNDATGRKLVGLLARKAREGVQVRVIYDSMGCMFAFDTMFDELREAGGEVGAFAPLIFTLNTSSHLRLNYRNHRKIAVLDGKIGYTGGMNIGDEYLGKHKKLRPWRDTHMRLTGSSVLFLQERFIMDWSFTVNKDFTGNELPQFFPEPEKREGIGVQIVSSGPDSPKQLIKSGMLEMIYSARKNIYIQTPYFTPDDSFLDALRIASRSGVDVRLMLPGIPDHASVHFATLSFAWEALMGGVRVFLYNGFLHAKTIVFDTEAATIGSSNIGNRSFVMNFEINAFIYDQEFARQQEEIFLQDQKNCREITEEWFDSRRPLVQAAFQLSRLVAPLM